MRSPVHFSPRSVMAATPLSNAVRFVVPECGVVIVGPCRGIDAQTCGSTVDAIAVVREAAR